MMHISGLRITLVRVFSVLCLPLLFLSPVQAQSTLGSIFGTITDSTGAVVPSASITVTSLDQGTVFTAKTSSDGSYRVTQLQPGRYFVTAQSQGFAKTRSEAIPVAIEATVRADLSLKPGSANVTVEVNAANALLDTGSAEVSSQVTAEELHELPSIDRNIVGLMSLGAGVTSGNYNPVANSGGRVATITGAEVVAMGTPPVGNSFLLDGVATNMEFSGTIAARPPMDMAAGFQTQIAQFPADEGRAAGAILNMSLKSGTNDFHGSVYGYVQNNAANAQPKNYFSINKVLPYHRYEYGANLGGPIIRNKLFFFAGWEGLKQLQTNSTNFTVPAMSEKYPVSQYATLGIVPKSPAAAAACNGYYFGATTDANGNAFGGYTTYDPTSVTYGKSTSRKSFTDNCIPASRISPLGQKLLQFYPDPNAGSRTYVQKVPHNLTGDWEVGKVNWTLTPADSVDMHLLRQNQYLLGSGINQSLTESSLAQNGINSGVNYFHIFSPNLVNVVRISYTRFFLWDIASNQTNYLSALIPGWSNDWGSPGPPTISPASMSGISPYQAISAFAVPFRLKENNYQLQDMLTWQHGRHSIKFGSEWEHIRFWEFRSRSGGGNLSFSGTATSSSSSATLSDGISDMILGLASSASAVGATAHYEFAHGAHLRTDYIMPYVQDDWRALSNLTINIGLRYNIFTPYKAEHDMMWNFDPTTPGGTVLIPSSSTYARDSFGFTNGLPANWAYVPRDQVYKKIYWKSFDPRIGYAMQINSKLVWRGGFGLYHLPVMGNTPLNTTTDGTDVTQGSNGASPFCTYDPSGWCPSVGLATGSVAKQLSQPGFVFSYLPRTLPDPYATKYNMDFQFSPTHNTALTVGYLGANTQHFASVFNVNQAPVASTTLTLSSRVPYPTFGQSAQSEYGQTDHTNYNGGIVSFQFQNWHGLEFKSYYTYSKTLGLGTGNDQVVVTPYITNYDYGRLDYDIRHRLVTTFIYHIPALHHPRVVGAILGQWDFSGIVNLQSGMPVTVTDSGGTGVNVGATGGSGQRPYLLHNPNLPSNKRSINGWFDTTAFAHTYWCTGAKANADVVTSTPYAITDPANPCQGIVAIPDPTTLTNKPSANHIVANTAQTMAVPWGNEGKNIIQGPGQALFTTALQRRFRVEKGTITLRLEEYNLFNHPNYANPGGLNLNATSFGLITSSQTYPRQLHGSLRFDF